MSDLAPRVARGAAFLGRIYPEWETMIDLGILNMYDCTECVVGQLTGSYNFGIRNIHSPFYNLDMVAHGFHLEAGDLRWDQLADLWRAEIARRLEVADA